MTSDRPVVEPVRRTGRAPVVDILAPPSLDEPQDALAALTPRQHPGELTPDEEDLLRRHARAKKQKAIAKAEMDALGPDIARLLDRILEVKAEKNIAKGEWVAVSDGPGWELRPFEVRNIWPKYRTDLETDVPHTRDELVAALREAGYGELIVEAPHKDAWPALVRDLVKKWRQTSGQLGVQVDGVFVDAFGEPLSDSEAADDPTADILALPRAIRRVIEPTELLDIRYTRAEVPLAPSAEEQAHEQALLDTAHAHTGEPAADPQ